MFQGCRHPRVDPVVVMIPKYPHCRLQCEGDMDRPQPAQVPRVQLTFGPGLVGCASLLQHRRPGACTRSRKNSGKTAGDPHFSWHPEFGRRSGRGGTGYMAQAQLGLDSLLLLVLVLKCCCCRRRRCYSNPGSSRLPVQLQVLWKLQAGANCQNFLDPRPAPDPPQVPHLFFPATFKTPFVPILSPSGRTLPPSFLSFLHLHSIIKDSSIFDPVRHSQCLPTTRSRSWACR